jgi:hypothetical protein
MHPLILRRREEPRPQLALHQGDPGQPCSPPAPPHSPCPRPHRRYVYLFQAMWCLISVSSLPGLARPPRGDLGGERPARPQDCRARGPVCCVCFSVLRLTFAGRRRRCRRRSSPVSVVRTHRVLSKQYRVRLDGRAQHKSIKQPLRTVDSRQTITIGSAGYMAATCSRMRARAASILARDSTRMVL